MTTKQAITILKLHNKWRKGANQKPSEITEAIDIVVNLLKKPKANKKE